jgi:hypothetical protein
MKTLAYGRVGNCLVLAHGEKAPAPDEWTAYVAFLTKHWVQDVSRLLVVTPGPAPSAAQRKEMNAGGAFKGRCSIVTPSAIARGIVTALSWFSKDVYATFAPQELDKAIDFLQLPSASHAEVKKLVFSLQVQLRDVTVTAKA